MSGEWDEAKCREIGSELFYPEVEEISHHYALARKVCNECAIKDMCLQFALDHMDEDVSAGVYAFGQHGMWGGTTAQERRRLRIMNRRAA